MSSRKGRSLVLGYHTVSVGWENSVAVRPVDLRKQLELVLAAGYRSVTFAEAVTRPDQLVVAVTFDDAFAAVHHLALPVLRELGMVATMFVPTAFVPSGEPLRWEGYDGADVGTPAEMAPLSWQQVGDLVANGWEIGSHTRRHPHLPRLGDNALLEELRISRAECEAGSDTVCRSIAYPYGDVDVRVRNAAAAAGYIYGAALGPQWRRGDKLWWPRTGVYRDDDLRRFRFKLRGAVRSRTFALGVTSVRRLSDARS